MQINGISTHLQGSPAPPRDNAYDNAMGYIPRIARNIPAQGLHANRTGTEIAGGKWA